MKEPSAGEREGRAPRMKEEREGPAPRMKEPTYWQENLRLVAGCLAVWFAVSFGCGILLVDVLDRIPLGGFRLGFWFAQQGSIYTFVVLIFVYAALMARIDKKYKVDEDDDES